MHLLDAFNDLPAYRDLLAHLQAEHPDLEELRSGLGLPRAARLPLVARLHADLNRPILLITNRADRALALFDELQFWLENRDTYYFPEPNPLFYEKSAWGFATRRDRLHVLTLLARRLMPRGNQNAPAPVVVAPVRAIMPRTLPRRDFLKHMRTLNIGQRVSLDELTRSWVDTGYSYANIVVEAGQFSRRGGILDVWAMGEASPVRIEFFDDEIETMRAFDPASQRTEKTLESFTLAPAREILPLAAEKAGLQLNDFSEFYLPTAHPFSGSLMDYLPDDALVTLDGQEFIAAAVTDIEEESLARRDEAVQAGEIAEDFPVPFYTWSEIEDRISKRAVVELGYTGAPDVPALASYFEMGPRFAGKLRDFLNYLKSLDNQKQPWAIVSRQSARLRNLYGETLIDQNNDLERRLNNEFIEGSLAAGWILKTPTAGLKHLLTDSEIFGWSRPQPKRRYRPTAEAPESSYADLEIGDWVVHVDHGIGKYAGLVQRTHDGVLQEFLCIEYADQDQLFVPIHHADRLTRYIGADGHLPTFSRLGGTSWSAAKQKVREAVQEIAGELLELYAQRQVADGFAYSSDTPWQQELEASFPYIETDDQLQALAEIKVDMEKPK